MDFVDRLTEGSEVWGFVVVSECFEPCQETTAEVVEVVIPLLSVVVVTSGVADCKPGRERDHGVFS
jgi:hypothetical protein